MNMPVNPADAPGRLLVPVVDIGPLRDGSDPLGAARALHQASRDSGFIYVSNHGIDLAVLDEAYHQALSFFRQSADDKQALGISDKHRGFLQMGRARMEANTLPDYKESFIWGIEDASGHTPEDHPLRGANRWPHDMPRLRESGRHFFEAADRVARDLLRGFALGLGLQPGFFLRSCALPMSRAAFVYYPPQEIRPGIDQYGVAPHTDFGVLTVLRQDEVGGLQVQDAQGRWVDAPPIPGTLVVNVGDLLSRWTNGVYRSTPHRVINASGRERLSLVLAFDPDPETLVDAREVFPSQEPLAPPIRCGDYLTWRFGKSFDYRVAADGPQSKP
jgi:isopenicillin N synthase-like dioxygenase